MQLFIILISGLEPVELRIKIFHVAGLRLLRASMAKESPFVTVIVLNHNGKDTIEKCLASVLSQDYLDYEVVIVDNASSDRSLSVLEKYATRINKILENSENLGYAAGMNLGAASASDKSRFLAFITQDVVLPPHWIRKMVQHAIANMELAAVSPRIYDESKRAYISELKILYPSAHYYIPLDTENPSPKVDFPAGEAFLMNKSHFHKLGMFDADYFAYYEDGDLGWRTRLAGLKILLAPNVEVKHYRSSVFGQHPLRYRVYLHEKNRISSCIKNLGSRSLLAFLLCEAFMLLFHFSRTVTQKDSDDTGKAYAQALFYVMRQLPRTLKKRRTVQKMRRLSDGILFRDSLPKDAMRRPGLVLAYSSKHKRKEYYYLVLLSIVAKIIPPM